MEFFPMEFYVNSNCSTRTRVSYVRTYRSVDHDAIRWQRSQTSEDVKRLHAGYGEFLAPDHRSFQDSHFRLLAGDHLEYVELRGTICKTKFGYDIFMHELDFLNHRMGKTDMKR